MTRKFFLFFCFFLYTSVCSASPEYQESLAINVTITKNKSYFVLSNGALFKIIPLKKRDRTFSEWWNNDETIFQSDYADSAQNWKINSPIAIFPKTDPHCLEHRNYIKEYAKNHKELKNCTHLLLHESNGTILFGMLLDLGDCMKEMVKDAFASGIIEGEERAKRTSASTQKKITQSYKQGYSEGWNNGYKAGHKKRTQENNRPAGEQGSFE